MAKNLIRCFNTQPRGGGCRLAPALPPPLLEFQHTAARRRLPRFWLSSKLRSSVSTHSRAEAAAAPEYRDQNHPYDVSTHSRAEAAALIRLLDCQHLMVSTHSRAEAAATLRTSRF